MGRQLFGVELGHNIYAENGDLLFSIIGGTAVPDGVSGKQGEVPIGSLYVRSGTAAIYKKIANAGNSADFEEIATGLQIGDLSWRNEKVRFVTADTLSAGNQDITALTDNDDMVIGDINVGEYAIGDIDGTPALFEITAKPGGNDITLAAAGQAISDNDTFVIQQYLPDGSGLESLALVHIPVAGAPGLKIADIDWALATGINLSGGYGASAGDPAAGDSVEVAVQKVDGNNDAQDSVLGTAQGATNLGAFAAPGNFLLSAALSVKAALQAIANFLFGVKVTQTTGVQAATAVDAVAHATYKRVMWVVEVFETATPANREGFIIDALTDGTSVDDNLFSKLKLGSNIGVNAAVAINGANMELQIATTPVCTVNVRRVTAI